MVQSSGIPLYFVGDGINQSYFMILIPAGLIGNTLSFLVGLLATTKVFRGGNAFTGVCLFTGGTSPVLTTRYHKQGVVKCSWCVCIG